MEKQIVERYIALYNAFEIEKMVDLFAEDCVFQNVSNTAGITACLGKKELLNLATQGAALFSERKQTVTNWIIGKDKIAIEIDYTARLACDFPNGLKKGELLSLKGVSVFEFAEDKITRLVDFS